jgi:RND family efflux transporter MFP subunit
MKSADNPAPEEAPKKKRFLTVLLQFLLSIVVLACAVTLAAYYVKTGPEAKPSQREPSPPLVEVQQVSSGNHRLILSGMGTILAAKEINLTPGVGGEIVKMSDKMVPGGFFAKDELLVSLDPADYQLTIMRLKSEVAKARYTLQLEMGNQRVSQQEFDILGQKVSETEKKLMLREPQLEIQKATLDGAKATLAQAELHLTRTRVKAPFNGVVLSRSVNLGARVSEATVLARLVGTDEFWLKLAIPTSQLRWITFPSGGKEGSEVRIFHQEKTGDDAFRTGRVIRLAADIEEQGRMAAVYVVVKDPLNRLPDNRKKPQLLLGSFVRAEIAGTELTDVVPIERNHLREGNSIWLLSDDQTLEIRQVDIVAKTSQQVFITSGLAEGEKLIVSDLTAPVAGIHIKLLPEGKKSLGNDQTVADDSLAKKRGVTQ